MPRIKKPKVTYQTYLFEIQDSIIDYHFSLNERDGYFRGPYWEHVSLEINVKATFPEKMVGEEFKICIMGRRELDVGLDNPEDDQGNPLAIGGLTVRGNRREYLGSIPQSSFWEIERRINEGQLKAINMRGHKLKYGRAKIRSIDFAKEFDPKDF